MRRGIFAIMSALVLLSLSGICRADGFIVIMSNPPPTVPGHFPFAPLRVTYHHVTVKIDDLVAVTSVDEEFYNPNSQRLEGEYLFPLPAGSHIDHFSMDINGQMTEAELLSADKARALYEDIVRKYRDPALLEYLGRDAFKVRIFPIEPNSGKRIKLQYTQLLKSDNGMAQYTYPLNTEKFSSAPLQDVTIDVQLTCNDPIKSFYSPTHNASIKRDGERHASLWYEQHNIRPDTDFKLIYSRSKAAVGVDLLTYRNAPDDGYFLLLASPGMQAPKGEIEKKDVCFVLDTSGSMAGAKIEQAKKALSFCLNSLNEGDRFEIVRFSTETEPLFRELREANKDNVSKALSFVKDLRASGGTDIDDALRQSLKLRPQGADAKRPYVIVFLTDGEPTVGETNEDRLVAAASQFSEGKTKVFCFGIGNDVNTHLLDRIADGTHAFSTYVEPQEDIEVKVSDFYTKVREPVLSNVELTFSGSDVHISQMYPGSMPDLYKGQMLVAFGRYTGHGPAAVKITGSFNGQPQQYVNDVSFTGQDTAPAYIPRLWAVRRVGYLLDQVRMHGESAELRDEITRLAREHGIVTPYTAYLILEDERARHVPVSLQSYRELGEDRLALGSANGRVEQARKEADSSAARSGPAAVAAAKDVGDLKSNANLDQLAEAKQNESLTKAGTGTFNPGTLSAGAGAQAAGGPQAYFGSPARPATQPAYGYRVAQNYTQQSKVINGRAFYQNGATWTDSTAQSQKNLKTANVKFGSDDYFNLLKDHPESAQWLSLANEVDVVIGDTLYQIR